MNSYAVWPAKPAEDIVPLTFQFGSKMQFNEQIIAATLDIAVYSGEDPGMDLAPFGDVAYTSQGAVTQAVEGGIPGVTYTVICTVATNQSHRYSIVGRLAVLGEGD